MPVVPKLKNIDKTIVFEDSKYGWAKGFQEFVDELYNGNICNYDLSLIRAKGERLKTFGGRASGPEPLELLLKHTERIFKVVVGGVRRSSCISLSNLSDDRMKIAKDGEFWIQNSQRFLSNNSVAYTEKPDMNLFINEWISLMKSGTGERGIFNREGCEKIIKKTNRRKIVENIGVNPCCEVILRPQQFCNLSEVVIRPNDTLDDLKEKIKSAVVFGCLQSLLTNFKYISDEYKNNCEEERLLGVSLTGLRDHEILKSVNKESKRYLKEMKTCAISYAKEISKKLNINIPGAITSVKPSGCTTLETKIKTSEGIKSMAEIFSLLTFDNFFEKNAGSWIIPVKSLSVYDVNNNLKEITKLFINGLSEVYEIEDEQGNIYKFTGEHKLKTDSGWKRVDELDKSDNIVSF